MRGIISSRILLLRKVCNYLALDFAKIANRLSMSARSGTASKSTWNQTDSD